MKSPVMNNCMLKMKKFRVIISGGGTGGHIFPALSIADALKATCPDAEILFVGAENRMEMQKVPEAGYKIIGLPVMGFDRRSIAKNFKVICRLLKSQIMAKKIIKDFKPDVVVGVGGYASGPTLRMASKMHIPTLIQEQNSYAGVTNRLLSKKVDKVCVAYHGMEKYFDSSKIVFTGNPVRESMLMTTVSRSDALSCFGLRDNKTTVLILGGSLGARTLNDALINGKQWIADCGLQFICQTGKNGYEKLKSEFADVSSVVVIDFIKDMGIAYKSADLVVSRAGAGAISELQLLGKPAILVPSPNVAEDHQTKNAMSLVNKNAALCVNDCDAFNDLLPTVKRLVEDKEELQKMGNNMLSLSCKDSAKIIAEEVIKLVKH